jgi:hypothetical protein
MAFSKRPFSATTSFMPRQGLRMCADTRIRRENASFGWGDGFGLGDFRIKHTLKTPSQKDPRSQVKKSQKEVELR